VTTTRAARTGWLAGGHGYGHVRTSLRDLL
jgi:hypothetical protein